jgi:preprotein translocase subunit SecA
MQVQLQHQDEGERLMRTRMARRRTMYEGRGADASSGDGGKVRTYRREGRKVGRNDPCPCGSGKKYKKCCMLKETHL